MAAPTGQTMYQGDAYQQSPPQYTFDDANTNKGSATMVPASGGSGRDCIDLNLDWGVAGATGKAGACWDIFRLEPCCGEPFDVPSCCYCCEFLVF